MPKRAVGPPPGRSETLTDGDKLAALEQPLMLPRKKTKRNLRPRPILRPCATLLPCRRCSTRLLHSSTNSWRSRPSCSFPRPTPCPTLLPSPRCSSDLLHLLANPRRSRRSRAPAPEPPPPFRPRVDWAQKREEFAKLSDPPWVGRTPEPPPTPVQQPEEHLEPAIIKNWQIPKAPPIGRNPQHPSKKRPSHPSIRTNSNLPSTTRMPSRRRRIFRKPRSW